MLNELQRIFATCGLRIEKDSFEGTGRSTCFLFTADFSNVWTSLVHPLPRLVPVSSLCVDVLDEMLARVARS